MIRKTIFAAAILAAIGAAALIRPKPPPAEAAKVVEWGAALTGTAVMAIGAAASAAAS
jgi:hypothetical protein